jgi:hypothetical protein
MTAIAAYAVNLKEGLVMTEYRWQFVKTDTGTFYIQLCDDTLFPRHGFALLSDDQAWEGGFGAARSWVIVDPEDVPVERREALLATLES